MIGDDMQELGGWLPLPVQEQEMFVPLTKAELALVHDLLDDHVADTRRRAFRQERVEAAHPEEAQRAADWGHTAKRLWAECELAGKLRVRLAARLDGLPN